MRSKDFKESLLVSSELRTAVCYVSLLHRFKNASDKSGEEVSKFRNIVQPLDR